MRLTSNVKVALSWVVAVCVLWLIYWNADLLLSLPMLGPRSNGSLPTPVRYRRCSYDDVDAVYIACDSEL